MIALNIFYNSGRFGRLTVRNDKVGSVIKIERKTNTLFPQGSKPVSVWHNACKKPIGRAAVML
jgi:hypothetical protein